MRVARYIKAHWRISSKLSLCTWEIEMQKNILLINPPFLVGRGKFSAQSRSPSISKGGTIYYPYFLAYATGVLEQSGYDVQLIDACSDQKEIWQVDVTGYPFLIIINTTTPSIYSAIETSDYLRAKFPLAHICLVGTHVTFETEDTFKISDSFSSIARGEYEYTLRDLAKRLQENVPLSIVDGLSYRTFNVDAPWEEIIIHNKDRKPIEDLDKLPFVSQVYKKHLNIKNYFFAASAFPMVMVLSSRGCSWGKCSFCISPKFEGIYRERSVSNFVDELAWIKKNMPEIKEIGIEDGTFGDSDRISKICQEILNRNLKIKWYCNVRVDLKLVTMKLMKKAGCHLLTVGFESSSQEVLKAIHKGITVKQMKEFMQNTKKAGLLVHGCFMSGNEGDTKEILLDNLKLAKELDCDTMQFFPLMVYPGTEAYAWAKKNWYIRDDNWSHWVNEKDGGYSTTISIPHISRQELIEISNDLVKKYHLRPKYIAYKLKQNILHPSEITRTLKGVKSFFGRK
jgi:anaerobic magnesium-protoporphyrin IX monomethyl ester cyclase